MGNAGAGKSTLAARLVAERGAACLCLDDLAWQQGIVRKPLADSLAQLHAFIDAHRQWVIEGCYGDLIEAALPHCDELIFLNPSSAVCEARCRERRFEPHKFATRAEQDAMLGSLIEWVRQYEFRDDEFGLCRHRRIFYEFRGRKREVGE